MHYVPLPLKYLVNSTDWAGLKHDGFKESMFFITLWTHLVNSKILEILFSAITESILACVTTPETTPDPVAAHHSNSFLLNVSISGSGTSSTALTVKTVDEPPVARFLM